MVKNVDRPLFTLTVERWLSINKGTFEITVHWFNLTGSLGNSTAVKNVSRSDIVAFQFFIGFRMLGTKSTLWVLISMFEISIKSKRKSLFSSSLFSLFSLDWPQFRVLLLQ